MGWRIQFGTAVGNDDIEGLAVDAQGNVYVGGTADLAHGPYIFTVVKYSPVGDRLWIGRYPGPYNTGCNAADFALDAAGNTYLTGENPLATPGSPTDYLTVKFNPQGQVEWTATYDGPMHYFDSAWAIALDDSGNVYVAGQAANEGLPYEPDDFATIKYNAQGMQQWVALYDGPGHGQDRAVDVAVDGQGNVYVFGDARRSGPSYITDWALVKYDAQGMQQWVACFGGAGYFAGNPCRLLLDDQDNILLTGEISSGGNADMGIVKYNPEGVLQWVAQYNTPDNGNDNVSAIGLDADGNVIVTGGTYINLSHSTITLKYDANGNLIWMRRYLSDGNSGYGLAVDPERNIYVTGYTGWGYSHCLTLKYSPQGDLLWATVFDDHNNCSRGGHVTLDGDGNVLVAGACAIIHNPEAGDDFLTIKYSQNSDRTAQGNFTQDALRSSPHILTNSPNPFNPSTTIRFELRAASCISLKVHDTAGRLVATLVNGWRDAGVHEVTFDGSGLPSGIYLARITTNVGSQTQKLVLMK